VVAVLDSIDDLENDLSKVQHLQEKLVQSFPRSSIALAGRLPSLLHKGGVSLKPPIVGGWEGTCYAMRRVALALADRYAAHTLELDTQCTIESACSIYQACPGASAAASLTAAVIGGGGFVGSKIVQDLSSYFRKVIAYDVRYTELEERGNVVRTNDLGFLREAQVSLIFTACGDDVAPAVRYLAAGSIVADDTHPCVSALVRERFKAAQVTLLKAAAVNHLQPVNFYPRLPNFNRDSIPGCLLEALVVTRHGHEVTEDFEKFCQEAAALGFGPQLMTDLHEPMIDSSTHSSKRDIQDAGVVEATV
jgi:hypothetical protein